MTSEQFRHLKTLDKLLARQYETLNYLKEEIKKCIDCEELLDINYNDRKKSREYVWEGQDDDYTGMRLEYFYSADHMLEEGCFEIDAEEEEND